MADQERPPVGSVAEEATRLLDALGGWAASAGYAGGAAPGAAHAGAGEPSGPGRGAGPPAEDGGTPAPGDADPAGGGPRAPHGAGHCEHCGAENGAGRAVVCGLCPVCQGIGLLRSVRPETVDRLADLAGAIAGTLRDLADHRRASATSAGGAADAGTRSDAGTRTDAAATRHPRSRVQDIVVDDETTATS